uniref:Uncharacterized protein n=1 Tax=Anguilla anguilla TaxID=7936 RepID=A0A0E9WG85_ANGAN
MFSLLSSLTALRSPGSFVLFVLCSMYQVIAFLLALTSVS